MFLEYYIINTSKIQELREEWERIINKYCSLVSPIVEADCEYLTEFIKSKFKDAYPIDISVSIGGILYPNVELLSCNIIVEINGEGNIEFELNPKIYKLNMDLENAKFLGIIE